MIQKAKRLTYEEVQLTRRQNAREARRQWFASRDLTVEKTPGMPGERS
mgnify:CR=1 FL=1